MNVPGWWIYYGQGKQHQWTLPEPPPWRRFDGPEPHATHEPEEPLPGWTQSGRRTPRRRQRMAEAYRAGADEAKLVNAAIYLRRPLLVTGPPGSGKSTLAYSIAHELDLGPVLRWPITSRTTLKDGLYRYDAIGRLHAVTVAERQGDTAAATGIGPYLGLGPLGTALLPTDRPRVLLIDELDKSDIDLPNDLLSVFEDGEYTIPELQRETEPVVTVLTDDGEPARISHGVVRCAEFPIVILTSNGERDFPAAFTRRCVRLNIDPPTGPKLERIIQAHLGAEALHSTAARRLFEAFEAGLDSPEAIFATDQLLNALRLEEAAGTAHDEDLADVLAHLLLPLNEQP